VEKEEIAECVDVVYGILPAHQKDALTAAIASLYQCQLKMFKADYREAAFRIQRATTILLGQENQAWTVGDSCPRGFGAAPEAHQSKHS
jgi:hypothetical protein